MRLYKEFGGKKWVQNIFSAVIIFPVPVFCVWLTLNNFAWAGHSTAALPFGTISLIFFLWAIISIPLSVLGAFIAKIQKIETNYNTLPKL